MIKNTQINRLATLKVATALGEELNQQVVYVGGAMVSLYINDPAAEDIRPTKDIDLTFEITSVNKLEELRERLVSRGFKQTPEDDVICRFRYDDLIQEAIPGHLFYERQPERLELINEKLKTLSNGI